MNSQEQVKHAKVLKVLIINLTKIFIPNSHYIKNI